MIAYLWAVKIYVQHTNAIQLNSMKSTIQNSNIYTICQTKDNSLSKYTEEREK